MKVLMIGAGRDVRGGVSSVVNSYYEAGLDKMCELTYLPTMEDGSKLKKLLVAAKARIRFEGLIRQNEILHVHMSSDNSFYRKAVFIKRAHQAGKKIVIHLHGSTFDLFYKERCNESQKSRVREIYAMADAVIALSEDWKQFLQENICEKRKITVIYNGVQMPKAYEKDYGNQKILFLGILGQRKGTYDLLEVLPKLFEKYPRAQVFFGGDGEREKAEQICRKKGISDKVTFLGWVRGADKEKLLKECSIYVLPTYHEGMPMSVLEAMSYGMAVVSTYVGGIPHIIESGKNGILCEPGAQEQLQNALEELLSGKERRKELGMRAAEKIQSEFNVCRNVDRLLVLYEKIRIMEE